MNKFLKIKICPIWITNWTVPSWKVLQKLRKKFFSFSEMKGLKILVEETFLSHPFELLSCLFVNLKEEKLFHSFQQGKKIFYYFFMLLVHAILLKFTSTKLDNGLKICKLRNLSMWKLVLMRFFYSLL